MSRGRDYVLALDQGTTSSRAILFDREGRPVAAAAEPVTPLYPRPGWVEQDPEEIWTGQLTAARRCLAESGVPRSQVAAVGIANQRETVVLWEANSGRPVGRAVVWQCRRSTAICEALAREGWEGEVRARTGLPLDPYFSGTKLRWLFAHDLELAHRARTGQLRVGTVDSWLVWRLTGGRTHVTDASNASRTLLFNLHEGDWDPFLLDLMGVPSPVLPRVVPSSGVVGTALPDLLGTALPVAGLAGDQQAALFGQACLAPGAAKITYGTGCFLLANTGEAPLREAKGLLATVAWRLGKRTTYALEGSVFSGGSVIQWLRDELGLLADAAESEALAQGIPDTGGVYLVPAFTGLGAPYWDPRARGILVGLTRGSGRAQVVRAALESIAYQCRAVTDRMEEAMGAPIPELRVDGGASANNWLMQFQADLTGRPVVRPAVRETTALGAALLAGLAVGVWGDPVEAAARAWRPQARFLPAMGAEERHRLYAGWQRAVELSRNWAQD